jgi:hypothetical protein
MMAAGYDRAAIDAAWDGVGQPQSPATSKSSAPATSWRQMALPFAILAVLVWFLFLRGGGGETAEHPTDTPRPTVEYMLAAIHGDLSTEAEFKRIVDQIQAGGSVCDPEPNRQHVGDVIVSSWEDGGKAGSLLDWARAIASVCTP